MSDQDEMSDVKARYAQVLYGKYWPLLKRTAEYYLRTSAILRTKDISSQGNRLHLRNSMKRLLIGVGCELLVKAAYLKLGYCVNKPRKGNGIASVPTHLLRTLDPNQLDPVDTYTFGTLIDNLPKVMPGSSKGAPRRGLRIAMVFRNKEGHQTLPTHKFEPQDFRDIEQALCWLYTEAFDESLHVTFSMGPKDAGLFRITTGNNLAAGIRKNSAFVSTKE